MEMKEWTASIKLTTGSILPVIVQARTQHEAKKAIEAQYSSSFKHFVNHPRVK